MCTSVLKLAPVYDPTHDCALLGNTQVLEHTQIWQCGVEQQPDMETLFEVKLNPCNNIT